MPATASSEMMNSFMPWEKDEYGKGPPSGEVPLETTGGASVSAFVASSA